MRVIGLAALCSFLLSSAGAAEPLFLRNGRFEVDVHWSAGSQDDAAAKPARLTDDSGYFTFFAVTNVEILVKVLDACGQPSPRYWVFAAGLTNVEVTIDVTDRWSGEHHTFHNPAGAAFAPIQRTDLFATCAAPPACGSGSETDVAATPRADEQAELIALFLDRETVARQVTYERVRNDLASIRSTHPDLSAHSFLPKFDHHTLLLNVSAEALHSIQNHTFPEWDCLNAEYGLSSLQTLVVDQATFLEVLRFSKRLFIPALGENYLLLSGVKEASAYQVVRSPELSYQDLCAVRVAGDDIVYFFLGSARQELRSHPGLAPASEPFDNNAAAACRAANVAE